VKILLHFLLATGLAIDAAAATAPCSPIPGVNQVLSKAPVHWVFVGELHGSNETPAAFGDLVCDALARGKRVTVALERPTSEQAALDGILTAQDLFAAKTVLLQQPGWKDGMDGRASEAMLRLLTSLRELRKSYPDLAIVAFDAPYTGTAGGARDEAMGRFLLAVGKTKPTDLILILVGNAHAMQAPEFGYQPAAMYLPTKEILSLEVTDRGGESWTWLDDGCGPSKGGVGDKGVKKPRGIILDPKLAPYGKVDGILSLGVALTSSAPAAGEATPVPDCRTRFLSKHPPVALDR
jgi:hypothetical protein